MKEALKLALEALKIAFDQTCSVGRPKDWQQIHEAITAIKEALAQPDNQGKIQTVDSSTERKAD